MIEKRNAIFFLLYLVIIMFSNIMSSKNINSAEALVSLKEGYTIPENCDFMVISNTDTGDNQCTPKLLDPFFSKFSGVLINGPKEVVWPSSASLADYPPGPFGDTHGPLRLMIAGIVNVKYSTLGLDGDFGENVLLVVVNEHTAQTYTGKMPSPDYAPAPPPEFPVEEVSYSEETLNSLVSSWFNLDLVHDLGLPIAEATYTVYATLGEYKSNVLTIKTTVK